MRDPEPDRWARRARCHAALVRCPQCAARPPRAAQLSNKRRRPLFKTLCAVGGRLGLSFVTFAVVAFAVAALATVGCAQGRRGEGGAHRRRRANPVAQPPGGFRGRTTGSRGPLGGRRTFAVEW